jgi:hypothetical protein
MITNLLPPNAAPWVPPVSAREPEEWLQVEPPEGRKKFTLQPWMIALLVILAAMIAMAIGLIIGASAEASGARLGLWWFTGILILLIGSQTTWSIFFIFCEGEPWSASILALAIALPEIFFIGKWLGLPFIVFGS